MALGEYLEYEKKYCPSPLDDICKRLKSELDERGIKCDDEEAIRLKAYLQWKCENGRTLEKLKNITKKSRTVLEFSPRTPSTTPVVPQSTLPHMEQVLPGHLRPESYEVWLWVRKEPMIIGNVTIIVNVSR